MMTSGFQRACHNGPPYACDAPGGCGSTRCGRTGTRTANACVTCGVYRPDAEPRHPNHPPVCDADRTLLDRHLVDVANLHAELVNPEPAILDDRQHERFGVAHFPGGIKHVFSRGMCPSDPLAALGGVAAINSKSKAPSVSGSRERPLPINASTADLQAPAKVPSLAPSTRRPGEAPTGWPEDQIGHLSVATILDGWARDWRDTLFPGQHLPPAQVDELAAWLRVRLADACDQHPAITEFADELKTLRGTLRVMAGETEPQPERCDGVPCRRCDMRMLFRRTDASGDVDCVNPDCRAAYRANEYQDWVKELAYHTRATQNA